MARSEEDPFEPGKAPVPADPKTAEYPEVAERTARLGKDAADPVAEPATPRSAPPADPPPPSNPSFVLRSGGGPMRGLFWLVATLGLVVALVIGARAVGVIPDLKNPFGKEQTDRSGPALLKSVQDLSQFVAAEGNFEVIVDVKEDRKYIPDFLVNQRILFVAAGSVEVYVDFASIGQGAVKESDDRRTVEISLPAPQLRPVRINHDRSYVYSEERGALNRLGDLFSSDPNRLNEVYKLSEDKIATAAKDAGLGKRAEDNTRKMLQQFLSALGYTSISVTFAAP